MEICRHPAVREAREVRLELAVTIRRSDAVLGYTDESRTADEAKRGDVSGEMLLA